MAKDGFEDIWPAIIHFTICQKEKTTERWRYSCLPIKRDGGCFILDSGGVGPAISGFFQRQYSKGESMTYLDVVFRYGAIPGETELRAIDGVREVYGIRGVHFNEAERTVRVGYDGSRLKADTVAKLLRQAGIDVREQLALA
jgi:hypothetical protein